MTFRVPGGQIGRYKNVMIGAPEFHPGEEAVLFLRAEGPSVAHVFGLNQGVFRVRVDARNGRRLVRAAGADGERRRARDRHARAPDPQPLPLDAFAATVRAAMAQTGGAQ